MVIFIISREFGFSGKILVCHNHRKAEVEKEERDFRRKLADQYGFVGGRVSSEALAMLGLSRPFTRADVLRAFRAKSLKAHPDQGGESDFFRALMMARESALADADDDKPESQPPSPASHRKHAGRSHAKRSTAVVPVDC